MDTQEVTALKQFREAVYQHFNKRADTLMELWDALCSNHTAESVAECSLTPCFRRGYSALYKGLKRWQWDDSLLVRLLGCHVPQPARRRYWLVGVDTTSNPRPFAGTLADRTAVYQANPVRGNRPVTIGHRYASVALLPEREAREPCWVVPLRTRRVRSDENEAMVSAEQVDFLLQETTLPWHGALCVEVGDSNYSQTAYLYANRHHPNLVTVARCRDNRVLYQQASPDGGRRGPGRRARYGARFALKEPDTWTTPAEQHTLSYVSRRGATYQVDIRAWYNLLVPGKLKPRPLPMYRHPLTLVRIVLCRADGQPVFKRPLWLFVIGERRTEISAVEVYQAYCQRFDLEHFFRFGKQRLLLTAFQTPDLACEEAWWQLVHLAYAQLWLARSLVPKLSRPWERYLPQHNAKVPSPTMVLREFGAILWQIGTPAGAPRPRGKSPGRLLGTHLPPRPALDVRLKTRPQAQSP
jgi:hypothetical protein